MNTRIHNQPHRAPHFICQLAEFRIEIIVKFHLVAERLWVKPPPFDKRGVTAVAPEVCQPFLLHCQSYLQMMPWNCLMKRQGHHLALRSSLRLVEVNGVSSGAGTVGRGPAIIGSGGVA